MDACDTRGRNVLADVTGVYGGTKKVECILRCVVDQLTHLGRGGVAVGGIVGGGIIYGWSHFWLQLEHPASF